MGGENRTPGRPPGVKIELPFWQVAIDFGRSMSGVVVDQATHIVLEALSMLDL